MARSISAVHYSVSVHGPDNHVVLYSGPSKRLADKAYVSVVGILSVTKATATVYMHSCGTLYTYHIVDGMQTMKLDEPAPRACYQ